MRKNLVIATRGSQLALWQAEHVKACLESLEPGLNISLRVIKTRGDIILDVPLSKVGGKGLFVKEIEEALLDGSADLAVHSIKDAPLRGEGSARTDVCVPSFSVKKSLWPYKDILTAEMAHTQQGSE